MQLSIHHKLALIGATVTSALALTDAATHGITGEYSWFADDSGVRAAQVFAAILHGLTYAARMPESSANQEYSPVIPCVAASVNASADVTVAPISASL